MIDGMLKSVFGVLKIDPEEGRKMVLETFAAVKSVDERLTRIEAALARIENPTLIGITNGSASIAPPS